MELGQAVAARYHFDPPLGHWAYGLLNERQTEPENSVSDAERENKHLSVFTREGSLARHCQCWRDVTFADTAN